MIRVNAAMYAAGLCILMSASVLRADEFVDKFSLVERMGREQSRLHEAMAERQPFTFDQDLVNSIGFDRLMQYLFPTQVWDTGILLPSNVEIPQTIPVMHPVGPEIELEGNFVQESPVYSSDELAEAYSPNVEGMLNEIFGPSPAGIPMGGLGISPTGTLPADTPIRGFGAARRNLLTELEATASTQQVPNSMDDSLMQEVQTPAIADRLMEMLIAVDAVGANHLPSPIAPTQRPLRRLFSTPTKVSGQKRERDESTTLSPSPKRGRTQKEKAPEEEEDILTPGDLTPVYDFMKPPRTPDDESDNGGGPRGSLPAEGHFTSSKRLIF